MTGGRPGHEMEYFPLIEETEVVTDTVTAASVSFRVSPDCTTGVSNDLLPSVSVSFGVQ